MLHVNHNSVPPSTTSVTLSTSTRSSIQWVYGLDDVTDEEIKELALQCRTAAYALETELAGRRSPQDDQLLIKYCNSLQSNARQITKSCTLSKEHRQQLEGTNSFIQIMIGNTTLDHYELKIARDFVWLISRWLGWPFALLVICSLGKNKLRKMNDAHRVKILKYISTNGALSCDVLNKKARELGLYENHTANHLLDIVLHKRKRRVEEISSSSDPRTLERSQHSTPSRPITPLQPNALLQHDDPRQPRVVLQHHISLPTNDNTSTEVNPQNKIKKAFSDLNHESKTLLKLFCLTSGEINRTSLRPSLIPDSSIQFLSHDRGIRSASLIF
ncbi:MAG: hypothetical protein Q9187_003262 [Circinaria calcarea]